MKMRKAPMSLPLVVASLLAVTATAQPEAYEWSTSFETPPPPGGLVTAAWDTVAGTLSLPPLAMKLVGSFTPGGAERDIVVDGHLAFLVDGRELWCRDAGEPATVPVLGSLHLGNGANRLDVSGGLVVVARAGTGLLVVDATDPAGPTLVATLALPAAVDVVLAGRTAYVADGVGHLRVVSLVDPAAPQLVASVTLPGAPAMLARDGDLLLVGLGAAGFATLDTSAHLAPVLRAQVSTPAAVLAIDVRGDRAFVTTASAEMRLYDLALLAAPQLVATLPTIDVCSVVRTDGDFLYAAGLTTLQRWEGPYGTAPTPAGAIAIATGGAARSLAVSGRHAYLAAATVRVIELTGVAPLQFLAPVTGIFSVIYDLSLGGDLLAVARSGGLSLVDVSDPDAPQVLSSRSSANVSAVELHGDRAVYIAITEGLVVLDVTNPAAPVVSGSAPGVTSGPLAVDGERALTSAPGAAVALWDLRDPASGVVQTASALLPVGSPVVRALDLKGTLAAIGTDDHVHIVDVTNVVAPVFRTSIPTTGVVRGVRLSGGRLFASEDNVGLRAWNVADPGAPVLLGTYAVTGIVHSLETVGDRAFLDVGSSHQLHEVQIGNPAAGMPILFTTNTGSSGWLRMAFAATRGWVSRDAMQLTGVRFATHAWQAEHDRAEVVDLPTNGLLGLRARASISGDPSTILWTVNVRGFYADIVPGNSIARAPWLFDVGSGDGDWSWSAAFSLGVDGNPAVVSDLDFEFLYDRPVITAATDVPNDQGRQLRLQWRRSGYDRAGSPQPLLGYAVYRFVDPALGTKALNPPPIDEAKSLPPGDWDYLGLVPADGEDAYSLVVPSLADQSAGDGAYVSTYLVRARTTTVGLNHDSLPWGGVSVDNLAPNVPQHLTVARAVGGNTLAWLESPESDLRFYNVYRGDAPGFTTGPATLVRRTIGTSWVDTAPAPGGAHYQVTAVDFAGNESAPAAASAVASVPGAPAAAFALLPNVPNPFNPRTEISFSLEHAGAARLRVFDIAGRLVRTLHDGKPLPAGAHTAVWDGRDNAGQPVAAGVYHCRLEAGGRRTSRALTLVK